MTFPYTIHISSYSLQLHGVLEFLGIFIAFRYYLFLKRRQGDTITASNRIVVLIGATFGAYLGSLEDAPAWFASPHPVMYFNGNKTILGGLLGGLIGVELCKKIVGEKQSTGDLLTFPIILGMIIGRIGCFSAGIYEETYGVPSSLPWAMNLGDGIYRHPVTLYEILFLVLLWAGLVQLKKNYILQPGAMFKLFIIAYLLFRFSLDFIKPGWRYVFGLGTIQLASLAGLFYYIKTITRPSSLIIIKATSHAS